MAGDASTVKHILYVGTLRPAIRDRFVDQALDLTVASDCYDALARLVRDPDDRFDDIIVDLGGLAPNDEEFFQLVSRRFRGIAIWVHGPDSVDVSATWAIKAGARGVWDWDQIAQPKPRSVAPTDPVEPSPKPTSQASTAVEPPKVEPEDSPAGLTDLLVSEMTRPLESSAQEGEFEGDLLKRRTQVQATRQQPAKSEPPLTNHDPELSSLLSEEELQALLSDPSDESKRGGQ